MLLAVVLTLNALNRVALAANKVHSMSHRALCSPHKLRKLSGGEKPCSVQIYFNCSCISIKSPSVTGEIFELRVVSDNGGGGKGSDDHDDDLNKRRLLCELFTAIVVTRRNKNSVLRGRGEGGRVGTRVRDYAR